MCHAFNNISLCLPWTVEVRYMREMGKWLHLLASKRTFFGSSPTCHPCFRVPRIKFVVSFPAIFFLVSPTKKFFFDSKLCIKFVAEQSNDLDFIYNASKPETEHTFDTIYTCFRHIRHDFLFSCFFRNAFAGSAKMHLQSMQYESSLQIAKSKSVPDLVVMPKSLLWLSYGHTCAERFYCDVLVFKLTSTRRTLGHE